MVGDIYCKMQIIGILCSNFHVYDVVFVLGRSESMPSRLDKTTPPVDGRYG